MIPKYGYLGLCMVIISFALNYTRVIPELYLGLIIPHYFYILGLFLFFDALDFKMHKNSLLHRLRNKDHLATKLVTVGCLLGILFEIYGVYISDLWYSYFQDWALVPYILHYSLGILAGYGLPALLYFAAYKVMSTLVKKEHYKKIELSDRFLRVLLAVGVAFLTIPFVLYEQATEWNVVARGFLFMFFLVGLWFVLEFFEHRQHKSTFLTTLVESNYKPLLSMLLVSTIISVTWELLNKLRPSWIYQNLPFAGVKFFGLPLALMLGWPFLFILYFSAYRIIFKDKETIW